MLHEESVGLSCHVFPAVYKLGDFFVSKVGVWTEASRSFMLVQINCQNHQLRWEKNVGFCIWNSSLLVRGNLGIWICHIISISVQVQSSFISIITIALLAEVSPHSVVLSDQLVKMLSVELIYSLCKPFKIFLNPQITFTQESIFWPLLWFALCQCQICLPNLVAHLVLAFSLCRQRSRK